MSPIRRLERIGRADQQCARLFVLPLWLHADPACLIGGEKFHGQAVRFGGSQHDGIAAVGIRLHVLRLQPERCAALLVLVKGEGYADDAGPRHARLVFQHAAELDQMGHANSSVGGGILRES